VHNQTNTVMWERLFTALCLLWEGLLLAGCFHMHQFENMYTNSVPYFVKHIHPFHDTCLTDHMLQGKAKPGNTIMLICATMALHCAAQAFLQSASATAASGTTVKSSADASVATTRYRATADASATTAKASTERPQSRSCASLM
jgi:hypothetical protein